MWTLRPNSISMSEPEREQILDAADAASRLAVHRRIEPPERTSMLPRNHPLRFALNDEVHARPPERLAAPARVSYLALLADTAQRQEAWEKLGALAESHKVLPLDAGADHYSADMGAFRLKAERHTEFVRFKFIVPGLGSGGETQPFAEPAISAVPAEWIAVLPGELMVATHVAIMPSITQPPDLATLAADGMFGRDGLMGAAVAGGAGSAYTDLRIREDGFGRLLILDRGMTPGQIGRALQRLLEMDTYRMLALLAFPVALTLIPALTAIEQELASITAALVSAGERDEPALLERLTGLAAQIESRQSETQFRFAAAASYDDLVQRRIQELREERIQGLQTFREFTERRLAPAMNTCRSVTARQEALSVRVAQATELLSTRVNLSSERQSQALLASMNHRAQLQIRLQQTVEGLSVAAITYYVVGLVGHASEGLEALGVQIKPALAMGAAIPVVAILAALGLRQIRRRVTKTADAGRAATDHSLGPGQ
jgi:uncharacterized membrane-anchored protein